MLPVIRYRYRVGGLLFLLAVITYLDRVCISFAGPRIQEYLRIGPQQWGWVVGVFAISYGAFEIPGGWMADRFGPRIILTESQQFPPAIHGFLRDTDGSVTFIDYPGARK